MGGCVGSSFCGAVIGVLSSLAITLLLRERESLLVYFNCVVAVCVSCLFPTAPWIGL